MTGKRSRMSSDYFDPRQIEAFVAVMSIGSMVGAARALGRSQPVITRLIKELETELGYDLLQRNGPRFTPTEKGVAFFAEAEMYLGGLRTIAERGRKIGQSGSAPMEIASIPSLAASLVPEVLASLPPQSFPEHVHLHTMSSENVVHAVVARTADLGFASYPLENPGIDILHSFEAPCVAVLPEEHPLARKRSISARDLTGQRLIASANPYRLRMQINAALEAHGVRVADVIDSNATYVSLALARQGLGIAIVENLTPVGLPVAGLRILPLDFEVVFRCALVAATGRPLSLMAQRLVEAARAASSQTRSVAASA